MQQAWPPVGTARLLLEDRSTGPCPERHEHDSLPDQRSRALEELSVLLAVMCVVPDLQSS